ncbi:MAG: capsular polysaccharide biosynthesis protein, partial [Gammaproteobacteria bacterium]|nr:capsular polysaccharide biosynthesis protein [Gammaproteobacteria bacterium]
GLGVNGAMPHSIIKDDIGIYYDATCPSQLEKIIQECSYNKGEIDRAKRCIDKIKKYRLTKYNTTLQAFSNNLIHGHFNKVVLVVDQRLGDTSIPYGMASSDTFDYMLECAISENPQAKILIKTHPDAILGGKKSHFTQYYDDEHCQFLRQEYDPWSLFENVDHVYVVSSLMGFEALMSQKVVTCFGAPFYAGWGLTDDRISLSRKNKILSLEELFYAAYIDYSHYINPQKHEKCQIEEAINCLIAMRNSEI